MTRVRTLALGGGLLALAVAGWTLHRDLESGDAAPLATPPRAVRTIAVAAVSNPPTAARAVTRAPAPPELPPPPAQPSPPEPRDMAARLDAVFAVEQTDATWAARTRSRIADQVAAVAPATSEMRSLECHASFCRLETVHESIAAYRTFLERAFLDASRHIGEGPAFTTLLDERGDGRVVAVSYLGRAGRGLPQVD